MRLFRFPRKFKLPWREAGPPNHLNDTEGSDQQTVNKDLSLCLHLPLVDYSQVHGLRLRYRSANSRHTFCCPYHGRASNTNVHVCALYPVEIHHILPKCVFKLTFMRGQHPVSLCPFREEAAQPKAADLPHMLLALSALGHVPAPVQTLPGSVNCPDLSERRRGAGGASSPR